MPARTVVSSKVPWLLWAATGAPLFVLVNGLVLPYMLCTMPWLRWLWFFGSAGYIGLTILGGADVFVTKGE